MKNIFLIVLAVIAFSCTKNDPSIPNKLSVEDIDIEFTEVVFADFGVGVTEDHFQRIYWFYDNEIQIGTESVGCEACGYYVVYNLFSSSTESFKDGTYTLINHPERDFVPDPEVNYAQILVYEIIPADGDSEATPKVRYVSSSGTIELEHGEILKASLRGNLWGYVPILAWVTDEFVVKGDYIGEATDASSTYNREEFEAPPFQLKF